MNPVELTATLIGKTELTEDFYKVFNLTKMLSREDYVEDLSDLSAESDLLAEAAGRLCYDSFHLPREATATNQGYLANIHLQRHFSVLEHASFSFFLDGVSRALLGELTRHRHQSFSVRSQRYCDEVDSDYVIPPVMYDYLDAEELSAFLAEYHAIQFQTRMAYARIQKKLIDKGAKRKVANDAARYVLPEATETKLIVTGNGRSWLELISKRNSDGAAEEIHQLATALEAALEKASPGIFQKG